MAANLSLNLKGLDALNKKLNGLPKVILQEIDGEIETGLKEVNQKQKSRAPYNDGALRQMNDYRKEKEGYHVLFNNAAHSVYVEFGTRGKVRTDILGNNLSAVAAEASFMIMRYIKKHGVAPQPFFFNSWFEERPKINKKIGDALRRAIKK